MGPDSNLKLTLEIQLHCLGSQSKIVFECVEIGVT